MGITSVNFVQESSVLAQGKKKTFFHTKWPFQILKDPNKWCHRSCSFSQLHKRSLAREKKKKKRHLKSLGKETILAWIWSLKAPVLSAESRVVLYSASNCYRQLRSTCYPNAKGFPSTLYLNLSTFSASNLTESGKSCLPAVL